jgi:type II secretory pathway component PulC
MVKGLLLRQAFVIIDLGLALLVAFLVYLIADQQLESRTPKVVHIGPTEIEPSIELAKVSPLDAYDMIGTSGLFGPAGDEAHPDEAVVPDTVIVPPPPTLRLHATAATIDPEDPVSTAIIENSVAQTVQKVSTYYRGQPVTDELVLKEVHPRKVVLHNPVKNSLSELLMPEASEKKPSGGPALAQLGRQPVQVAQNTEALSLDRNAVAEELASYDYADVVNTLNPEMAEDENGNVTGITSSNFAAVPLASEIGLQNGDVINTVNGIKIDSDQKLMEIFTKFSNASTFRLGITRNGSAQMLTFKLE